MKSASTYGLAFLHGQRIELVAQFRLGIEGTGMKDEIKLKIKAPRIEIALGSISSEHPDSGPYVAVAMLHVLDDEVLYQPLMSLNAPRAEPQLHREAAGDLLAEIYDFICDRWGVPGAHRAAE